MDDPGGFAGEQVGEIVVPARCCGPSASGNGGWCSGVVANFIRARPAQVSLRLPPPLDEPLDVLRGSDDDHVVVQTGAGALVAEGGPGQFTGEAPGPVALEDAERASTRFAGFVDHAFPDCFTCGPARSEGDGLRVFPGPLGEQFSPVAAVVHTGVLPDAVDGVLPEPVVWAILDCPSAWPMLAKAAGPMVLARMTAEVLAPVPAVDLVVVGAQVHSEGRKHWGASALYTPDGELLGRAEALWIELAR